MQHKRAHKTATVAPEDRIPTGEKVAYAMGGWLNESGSWAFKHWAGAILPIVFGLNPTVVANVLGLMRIWDAVTDPLMGRISDNSRLTYGRRKPYIIVGALLCAVAFPLIWFLSPEWSETTKTVYFLSLTIVFYTAYTIYNVPYEALRMELTPDYTERTRLSVVISYISKAFGILMPWYFPLTQSGLFGDPVQSSRIAAIVVAVVIAAMGVTAGLRCEERYQRVARQQEKVKVFQAARGFLRDVPFWLLQLIVMGLQMSNVLVHFLGLYLSIYYVWGGSVARGSTFTAIGMSLATMLQLMTVFIVGRWFSDMEKTRLLRIGLCLSIAGTAFKWLLITPEHPLLMTFAPVFMAPAFALFWLSYGSMQPDYMDYDEWRSGKRREGLYGAVSSWVTKACVSLGTVLSGYVLAISGFNLDLKAEQADGVFLTMRILYVGLPMLLLTVALICTMAYPLTRPRILAIRRVLEKRRGSI